MLDTRRTTCRPFSVCLPYKKKQSQTNRMWGNLEKHLTLIPDILFTIQQNEFVQEKHATSKRLNKMCNGNTAASVYKNIHFTLWFPRTVILSWTAPIWPCSNPTLCGCLLCLLFFSRMDVPYGCCGAAADSFPPKLHIFTVQFNGLWCVSVCVCVSQCSWANVYFVLISRTAFVHGLVPLRVCRVSH